MSSGWPMPPPQRGPRRGKRRGPRFTGQKHHLPTATSGCRIRTSRSGLRQVRGSHKRDRRPPLVRWKLRCPRRAMKPAGGGRSNGVRPSLSSDFLVSYLMLSAGVRTPRDFMAPNTCDGTYCCGEALQTDVGPPLPTAMVVLVLQLRGAGTAERGRGPGGSAPSPRAGGSSAFVTILLCQPGKR